MAVNAGCFGEGEKGSQPAVPSHRYKRTRRVKGGGQDAFGEFESKTQPELRQTQEPWG